MSTETTPKSIFLKSRSEHWEKISQRRVRSIGRYYHEMLSKIYRYIIPAGSSVLELGCGKGELLASLSPSRGVGIDFSPSAIEAANSAYPHLLFKVCNVETLNISTEEPEEFDFIILSDLVNDLWDIQSTLEQLLKYCHPRTRIILNFYSHLWQAPLRLARRLGLATPLLRQNWVTVEDVRQLFTLSGFETLKSMPEILVPVGIPGANLINRYLPKIFPFRFLAMTNFVIGLPVDLETNRTPSCSVIVAARNEEGHIKNSFSAHQSWDRVEAS